MAICVGCGLKVDPTSGLLEVERRPGGGIGCQNTGAANDGLYVIAGEIAPAIEDSATIDMVSSNPIRANVREASTAFNSIELHGDGIYARCPSSLVYSNNYGYVGASFPVALNTGGAGLFSVLSDGAISVTNPFPWTVEGFWEFRVYGGWVRANPGFDGFAFISRSINGGSYDAAIPLTNFRMDNRTNAGGNPNGGVVDFEPSAMIEKNYINFGPGQNYTFSLRVSVQVTAGTGTWLDFASGGQNPYFEIYIHCTQTGSC